MRVCSESRRECGQWQMGAVSEEKISRGFARRNADQEKEPFEKEGWAVERYIIWKGRAADLYDS
jgi:hypothetical protein